MTDWIVNRRSLLAAGASLTLGGCATAMGGEASSASLPRISADGRFFVGAGGRPFFWLADTAWELFHRLTLAEATDYLEDRRRKGFTVIQAVALAEQDGLRIPNANGDLPLIDLDPTRLNEPYFAHVDAVIAVAAAKGLTTALLPTWGDKFNLKWGIGPEIFTPDNARTFAALLARRYRHSPVVWVLGGDRNPETPAHYAIVHAMAEGIRSEVGRSQLISYHPQGQQRSWDFFADAPWIDFHMYQSGHARRDLDNAAYTRAGRALNPHKPVIDAEPRYEDIPIDFKVENGRMDAADIRQAAWWSVLTGAAGHSYGDHNIWQFWQPDRAPILASRTPWRAAMGHPGAFQMGLMRRLMEEIDFANLRPADEQLAQPGEGGARQVAAVHERTGCCQSNANLSPPGAVRAGA